MKGASEEKLPHGGEMLPNLAVEHLALNNFQ
jgi:hypothetical protein